VEVTRCMVHMLLLADVYSYPEDDMVIDPLLADHLAHFGIDIMSMKKVKMSELLGVVS